MLWHAVFYIFGGLMLGQLLNNVRNKGVLIHNITNYVTVNDVANLLLASGARPIMAEAVEEVEEITSICQGLYINIGTLTKDTVEAMHLAVKKANELNHPVILDPVGMGASKFRNDTVNSLIDQAKFTVVRGNVSEIRGILTGVCATRGVDTADGDEGSLEGIDEVIAMTQELSKRIDSIIVATGIVDVISNKDKTYLVHNGNKRMSDITGTGCMLSALIAAFITSNSEKVFESILAAVSMMGLAGEIAMNKMESGDGNATFRVRLIDAISTMGAQELNEGARYECR